MSFSVAGKTAIVTGASSGVGLAIGRHLADKGANVVFADHKEDALLDELGANEDGKNTRFFAGNLFEKLTMANLISATIDAYDSIDILVNGSRKIIFSDPLSAEGDPVENLINQNVLSSLRLSQLVAKRMIKQSEGSSEGTAGAIISLSSISAQRTHPQLLAHSMATAALDQMTRTLGLALAPHRIRVNAVAFGSVMSASLKEQLKDNPEYKSEIEAHTPLGRIASPNELAEAVHFLASDASSFMTGQIMTLDGGRTLLDPVAAPAH